MRWVRTRVLPEPGPASTSTGPVGAVTACALLGIQAVQQIHQRLGPSSITPAAAIRSLRGWALRAMTRELAK